MNQDKQKLMLSYLMSSNDLFVKAQPILQSNFFDLEYKKSIDFIKGFYLKYKAIPTDDQLYVETKIKVTSKQLSKAEMKYAETELESFCQYKAIETAISSAVGLMQDGRSGEIVKLMRDAVSVGFQRTLGTDYFADPEGRLNLLATTQASIPTGIKPLDDALGGGLNRKEMIIFAAPSGVGKSITMSNVAKNLIDQGYYGIYITLELSEEMVAKRFDSILTGVSQAEILKNITKVSTDVKKAGCAPGQFVIKRMPESATNANHIRAFIKEYENEFHRTPDFLVVDYLDIMASNDKISAENVFVKDKYIAEELRALADEFNLMMITASQLNRGAQTIESLDELNHSHIAGGISKVNTTDNFVAIVQNQQQKSRGELMFKMLKTRSSDGVGKIFMLKFNSYNLRITAMDNVKAPPQLQSAIERFRTNKMAKTAATKQEPEIVTPPKLTSMDSIFQVD